MGEVIPPYFDTELRSEDRVLLDRYLPGYLKILEGRAHSDTEARKRFVQVAGGKAMPLTNHEAAFVRWQIAVGWRQAPTTDRRTTLLAGTAGRVAAAVSARSSTAAAAVAKWANVPLSAAMVSVSTWYSSFLATDAVSQLDSWMRDSLTSGSSIYDRAMDSVYVETAIGGKYHRLFDGQHDLIGAWNAAAAASPDDSTLQEVAGYFSALWNDMATPMGLPIATLSPENFDQIAAQAEGFLGVSRGWLYDGFTQTASELAGAALGALAVCLCWSAADTEEASRLAGSTIMASALAANPALLLVSLVCFVRAFHMAKHGKDLSGLLAGVSQGGAGSAAFVVAASLVSGPVWVTALTGIVACVFTVKATQLAGQQLGQVDWTKIAERTLTFFKGRQQPIAEPLPLLLPLKNA
jgi:hypothetical protein